ncbi:uncharacterized protein P174DRAFT_448943 [Aspergillus novofumigatus IBT 16806]|uniref:Uncharacterized protein n=1 Tax=Aspergillus novofumigatus (strain IBT 16806) TaxID=1392255 RepID=A0A2I1CI60_ASPN1|nr:uncharacterized protein P174DRAFT_448943 [Aspergillus novofumigatus IBT 16806]PKX97301.1 hypothetical protein P174DRAFT_448943 [Aspergillus novofumigatus IBT 16806]
MSLLTLLVLSVILTSAYFYVSHCSLASRIHPVFHTGTLPRSISSSILSIPPSVYTKEYFSLYNHASRSVPHQLLPSHDLPALFVLLLRRNLTVFSHFPKAWKQRSTCSRELSRTFRSSYIQSLDFNEGDIVCKVYRVLVRKPDRVEFAVDMEECDGRWVLRYWEEGEDVVFCSEAVSWRPTETETPMPGENRFLRFIHETMTWWLLDSGVRYLMDLDGELGPEEEETEDKELVK